MPFNYLDLQPKIRQYAQKAARAQKAYQDKVKVALDLLQTCATDNDKSWIDQAKAGSERCALPTHENVDAVLSVDSAAEAYVLLAADGSQIVPSAHDAVPLSLINTSLISMKSDSPQAPSVEIRSEILEDPNPGLEIALMNEDIINLERDVSELKILSDWNNGKDKAVVALRDGPLELYHQPRQGKAFEEAFQRYKQLLLKLAKKDYVIAGYIDRPRATALISMLGFYSRSQPAKSGNDDLKGLPDILLMGRLLKPGERSAIFALQSSSSQHYQDDLSIRFFYMNVGKPKRPYIVRVEIPAWVANVPEKVALLQYTLLDQCALMGSKPYPYILHRAHEEAVVHFDEKEQLQNSISLEMQREGLGFSQPSNKQSAKELGSRTRM